MTSCAVHSELSGNSPEEAFAATRGKQLKNSTRNKNTLDAVDRAADEMRQIAKRWQDRMAVERHTIAENYAEGRLTLICDLHFRVSDTGVRCPPGRVEGPFCDHEMYASAIFASNISDQCHVFPSDQQPMLIFDVENIQSPEGFSSSSRVWLYPVHDVVDDCFGGLLFQSTVDGTYKALPRFVKGKLGEFASDSAGNKLHFIDSKVKSGRKIVNRVAYSQEHIIGNSAIRADLKEAISGLRIVLDHNSVRASVIEVSGLQVEIIDVLVGPFDF